MMLTVIMMMMKIIFSLATSFKFYYPIVKTNPYIAQICTNLTFLFP